MVSEALNRRCGIGLELRGIRAARMATREPFLCDTHGRALELEGAGVGV